MSNIYRMTISIPQDLKNRMDTVSDPVNWSARAAKAFEEALAEIAAKKEVRKMEDVIQRLRVSKQRCQDEAYREGEECGRSWAEDTAEADQLERLERLKADSQDWDRIFEKDNSPAEGLATVFDPDCGKGRWTYEDDWKNILGDDGTSRIDQPAFVRGFAEGALSVWNEVKNKL
jgi:hypothetical protein